MNQLYRVGLFLAVAMALGAPDAWAQARKVAAPPTANRDKIEIKKLEGVGTGARIKTPEYVLSPTETSSSVREWSRIQVRFDTDADWVDELEFRYFVQVHNPKSNLDMLFPGTFTYVDIPKGRGHLCTAFLRPGTLDRYGDVIGVAVEIYFKGELAAFACNPESPKGWWRTTTVKTVPGVLLERSQTPFAFVAPDNYVTAKPR